MKESKALNSAEAFPVIARYFKSGLRPHEFYKKVGWSDNQFSYWKKRYMSDHNMVEQADEPTSQFHPIDVVSTPISKGILAVSINNVQIKCLINLILFKPIINITMLLLYLF